MTQKNFSPIGPAVWPPIRNIYRNILFYYKDNNYSINDYNDINNHNNNNDNNNESNGNGNYNSNDKNNKNTKLCFRTKFKN